MMHGVSMAPASSYHGGCPPIAENQEFAPCMPPPLMPMMQHDVTVPNPGYKIAANLWDLNIPRTYSKKGTSAPADDMHDLQRSTSIV